MLRRRSTTPAVAQAAASESIDKTCGSKSKARFQVKEDGELLFLHMQEA